MSPSPPNLSLVFSLAPKDAIDYFEAKGLKLNPEGWASVRADSHAKAFTVSRMTRLDLLQDIRTAIDDAISKGTTFAEFQRTLTPTLKARGWWGIDPDTGVQLGSPHRLATIFRTNVQTSYMEGRWRGIMEGVETHPWIKYIAILDGRTRPAHRLLNGKVFRYDDPFWQRFRPPLGWNCRCRMTALSDKDLTRRNLRPDSSSGRINVQNIEAQGYPQPQASFLDPTTGNTVKTDVGWGYDRLKGWEPDPQKYAPELKPIAKSIISTPPDLPMTIDDFIREGRAVTNQLPDASINAEACYNALMEQIGREVKLSTPCTVSSSGEGAKLIRQASQRYPDTWTQAADAFGPLIAKSKENTRGFCGYLPDKPPAGGHWRLKEFGIVKHEDNLGYIMVRKGDVGNAVHEYAHRLQRALPGLDRLFQELHQRRTAGDTLKRLMDLEPTSGYSLHEVTREDHYTRPYQGREYNNGAPGGALEVMTMAFESVLGPFSGHWRSAESVDMFRLMYRDDREMFDFVVGLLRYWNP